MKEQYLNTSINKESVFLDNNTNYQLINLTPEIASLYMSRNNGNRKLSNDGVDYLVQEIISGRWQVTGDPIKLDENGNLIDGQHRCQAVVKSGIPIKVYLITGLNKEKVFGVIDTGRSRTTSQCLAIMGHKNTTILSSCVKLILSWQYGIEPFYHAGNPSKRSHRISNRECIDFIINNPSIKDVSTFAHNADHIIPKSVAGFIYYTLMNIDSLKAKYFLEKLLDGVGLEKGNPIYALREALIRTRSSKDKNATYQTYYIALIFKSWNSYRKGLQIKLMRFDKNTESYPVPI